jgi:uncharacterized protein YbjQ (UPF0145 family)
MFVENGHGPAVGFFLRVAEGAVVETTICVLRRRFRAGRVSLKPSIHAEAPMLVTTTPNVEGRKIIQYLGIVSGEAVVGANIFRDLFAKVRDIVGGRSGAYENVLAGARQQALEEMTEAAARLGGNAVVGVDLDYEVVGESSSMLMVTAAGTAVVLD